MSTVDLDALQKLADEATPGPWTWTDHRVPDLEGVAGNEDYSYQIDVLAAAHYGECGCRSACTLELYVNKADSDFIAAARTAVPALIAELRATRTENEQLRATQVGGRGPAAEVDYGKVLDD
jgi:hypothetical protein